MKTFKITWLNEDGWGRWHDEETMYYSVSSEKELRNKLNLPGRVGSNGYDNYDTKKEKLFIIEEIKVNVL